MIRPSSQFELEQARQTVQDLDGPVRRGEASAEDLVRYLRAKWTIKQAEPSK